MDDLKDQSAVSTTATNGVVESEEVRAQEALLGDTDPSLTSADDVAKALNVDPSHGLSEEEAKRRLAKFGPNELASAPPVPKWKKFLAQFQDPLVYLLIAATIISVIAWFIEKANAQPGAEGGEVLPFDAIVIILILIVNAVLGYMQEAKAEAAVEALAQMTAPQTSVLRDDKVMRINTADVVPGDIIVLAEGDSVSADGRLVNAASLRIAEASLTGESVPVSVGAGKQVYAGTVNLEGAITVEVTSRFADSSVARILELVEQASANKAPIERFITRFARYYTPAVVFIAALVAVIPPLAGHGTFDEWLYRALVLLVISCPCALVISIPLGYFGGIGAASKKGILVKGGHVLDALHNIKTVAFDKTGTLTRGVFEVTRVLPAEGASEEDVLNAARLVESRSTHPIARAIMKTAPGSHGFALEAVESKEIPGKNSITQRMMTSHFNTFGLI